MHAVYLPCKNRFLVIYQLICPLESVLVLQKLLLDGVQTNEILNVGFSAWKITFGIRYSVWYHRMIPVSFVHRSQFHLQI